MFIAKGKRLLSGLLRKPFFGGAGCVLAGTVFLIALGGSPSRLEAQPTLAKKVKRPAVRKAVVSRISARERTARQRLKQPARTDLGRPPAARMAPDVEDLPALTMCNAVPIDADLVGQDGVDERYAMVSLLECNGRNLVSRVRSQRGGTCGTYSAVASLEILLGLAHEEERPVTADHPVEDFMPVDLSEGYALFSSHYYIDTAPVLAGIDQHDWWGATADAFFPDPEWKPNWAEWDQSKADALMSRYAEVSGYCTDLEEPQLSEADLAVLADPDEDNKIKDPIWDVRFKPIFDCIFDAAKRKGLVFVSAANQHDIAADQCIDTVTGQPVGACAHQPGAGTFGHRVQVDYERVDNRIEQLVRRGYAVRTNINWKWDAGKTLSVDVGSPYYDFRRLYPRPLADYETAENSYVINGRNYSFPGGHSVLIVGYLRNRAGGQDFWIIKNSHNEPVSGVRPKDSFMLIGTAGSSGAIDGAESTKRNLFLSGHGTRYNYLTGLRFYRFTPNTNSTQDILAGFDPALATHDGDGDGVADFFDNCPDGPNPAQADGDQDFVGDACDACPNTYDRYQDQSDVHLVANDMDEDGQPVLCDAHNPATGLALLGLAGNALEQQGNVWEIGQFHQGWRLGMDDEVVAVGDFDGDGKDEFLLRSGWGLAVVENSASELKALAMVQHDTDLDGWRTAFEDAVAAVADLDGDGAEEILMQGAAGLAIFHLNGTGQLAVLKHYHNGDWLGGWHLGADNVIAGSGDFDGDGRSEFVIRSPWGMGLIRADAKGHLSDLTMFPVKTRLGRWRYNADDRLAAIGNFDGNDRDDLMVQSTWGLGILSLNNQGKLIAINMAPVGTWLGKWHYGHHGPLADDVEAVGDFDNDGRDEFLFKSPWGIGLMCRDGSQLRHRVMVKHGAWMGSWHLGPENLVSRFGDFDGDGRDEFVVRSAWGLGIIGLSGQRSLKSVAIQQNKAWLGDWFLRPENVLCGVGNLMAPDKAVLLIKTSR